MAAAAMARHCAGVSGGSVGLGFIVVPRCLSMISPMVAIAFRRQRPPDRLLSALPLAASPGLRVGLLLGVWDEGS